MKKIVIDDARGHVVAVVGSQEEFGLQDDSARVFGAANHEKMAWIDWIESSHPGMGSELMRALLMQLEAEGVSLVGLEACSASLDEQKKLGRFYEKFGFIDASILVPYAEHPVFIRDASWNGLE